MEPTDETRQQALKAIGEEADKLLAMDLTLEVEERIQLILALANYEHDLRTDSEKARQ